MGAEKTGKKINLFEPWLDEKEIDAAANVIRSGWLSNGKKTEDFEKAFAEYSGTREAVAVSSCTSALHISLVSAGVSSGHEVITTPFTFVATVNSILYTGAKPVFADIKKDDFLIDVDDINEKITSKTRAIMPVHYAGMICDMKGINDLAADHNLVVIEDAAHAVGAEFGGKKAGAFGDYGCFSFYPNKNMTTAEGGMITLDDSGKATALRQLRAHGMTSSAYRRDKTYNWDYDVTQLGYNYRMNEIEAAIGIEQLKKIDEITGKRRTVAQQYDRKFSNMKEVLPQRAQPGMQSSYHFYPIVLDGFSRDDLLDFLRNKGIMASVHYRPVYLFESHRKLLKLNPEHCPVAEDVFSKVISLPSHPFVSESDVDFITTSISEGLGAQRNG